MYKELEISNFFQLLKSKLSTFFPPVPDTVQLNNCHQNGKKRNIVGVGFVGCGKLFK